MFIAFSDTTGNAYDYLVSAENREDLVIYIAQNDITDYFIGQWPNSQNGPLSPGRIARVRTYEEVTNRQEDFATLELAEAFVATGVDVAGGDGYDILDLEQPIGSAPTRLIKTVPPTWKQYYEVS